MELTPDVVVSLIRSEEKFPIDFDDAWRWIGYSSKQKAFDRLKESLEEGLDFLTERLKNTGKRGRPSKRVKLTIDGFKMFCQAAGTDKGKQVRRYFVECQKELERRIEQDRQNWRQRQVKGYVLDVALPWNAEQSGPRPFVTEFYEHLYRIRGGNWAKRKADEVNRPSCVGGWTNKFVYELFPGDVPKVLTERYKSQEGNRRKYEFLTEKVGRIHLVSHMTALLCIMRISPSNNWDRFLKNIDKAFPDPNTVSNIQLEFDFLIEIEEECRRIQDSQAS